MTILSKWRRKPMWVHPKSQLGQPIYSERELARIIAL